VSSRRGFLKAASALAAGAATSATVGATACAPDQSAQANRHDAGAPRARATGFNRPALDALGDVMLPASLGNDARRAAVTAFVAWVDAYEPVAEEMHGYGYADVRYLPSDPAPAWRAQLDGLDRLASKIRKTSFAQLDATSREAIVASALRDAPGDRLPSPLYASHIALALVAHWASSPQAWNLALGAQVSPNTCRQLDDGTRKPLPIAPTAATGGKS